MKLIALGDTHGRTDWKQIISNTEYDKVVFIGDYFDTHEDITPEQQKSNFEDLIEYKKSNMDKVVLLFGNHDYHYLRTVNETYSGFQEWHRTDIAEMLHKALDADLMQMCLIDGNYIFSHAGITKTWLKNTGYTGEEPLELFINDLFKYQPLAFRFTSGINHSPYGDDICQTPIWVRPQSLYADCLDDYIQVVGHTTQKQLKIVDNKIVLIDTIGMSGQFLCVTDGEMSVLELYRSNGV
jgi:predicted phosphodiesterase